ncbi:MAG TPA: hypothetical protein VFO54_00400 [Chryseosolibacter sp.]|nr:hypothetical protein [Chryseosolibacter sp.]
MRFLFQILVIIILGSIMEFFLPWWSVAIAAFAGGLIVNARMNFVAGFLAIGLLWFVKASISDLSTDSDLTQRVALIFMLQSKVLLFLVTILLAGLVGGFASMSGGALRKNQ